MAQLSREPISCHKMNDKQKKVTSHPAVGISWLCVLTCFLCICSGKGQHSSAYFPLTNISLCCTGHISFCYPFMVVWFWLLKQKLSPKCSILWCTGRIIPQHRYCKKDYNSTTLIVCQLIASPLINVQVVTKSQGHEVIAGSLEVHY